MDKGSVCNLWNDVCRHLRQVLQPDVFSRWIEVIEPVAADDDTITLAVDNDFYQTWLEDNYLSLIQTAIRAVRGEDLKIAFAVKERPSAPVSEEAKSHKKSFRERLSGKTRQVPTLNPKFTFDAFVVGPSNSFSHAAALAVAQAPARAYNPLFIYGDVGLGKTHLMQAIGHHVLHTSRASVCYLSTEALMNDYIDALQNRSLVQYRKKYRNADLLLIDDIHFLANKERMQEEFFHTFNALFDARKQIVMTSDRPASEITGLERRLVSRFEWGLVTQLEQPDLETRIAILRNKQALTNSSLPEEFLVFIAENVRSNVRRLEGALIRAVSYTSLTRRELTLESLRNLLRDTLDQEKQSQLTFDGIQRMVADHFDIRVSDMSSKRRPQEIVLPRQIAMYLCRRMTRASLPDIATSFNKTHATILYAYKSIENRMDVDPGLKREIAQISEKLGRPVV